MKNQTECFVIGAARGLFMVITAPIVLLIALAIEYGGGMSVDEVFEKVYPWD